MPPNSLKRIAFPSITGSAASGPMSPRPSTAVPSVTTATAFCLTVRFQTFSGSSAIALRDARDAGRVGHREVVARLQRGLRHHLELAAQVEQERPVGDVLDLDPGERAHRLDDACDVRVVGGEHGHVADLLAVLDPDEVDRAEQAARVADRASPAARRHPGWLSRWTRRVALKEADGCGAVRSRPSFAARPSPHPRTAESRCGFSAPVPRSHRWCTSGSAKLGHAARPEIEIVAPPIPELAAELGLLPEELQPYGRFAAKIELTALDRLGTQPDGKLVCVTAMTPTKAGEGKTTTAISLVEALGRMGKRPILCLREPSLGPVFGIKGGGTGGGRAQLVPKELINLHFTGDIHAIGAANNLLAAMVESHLLHGNALGSTPLDHLAALPGHGRPRPARGRRRSRRPHQRRAARDRLRHHGRVRGDGDRRRRADHADLRAGSARSRSARPSKASP